jgi:hypothetical protein
VYGALNAEKLLQRARRRTAISRSRPTPPYDGLDTGKASCRIHIQAAVSVRRAVYPYGGLDMETRERRSRSPARWLWARTPYACCALAMQVCLDIPGAQGIRPAITREARYLPQGEPHLVRSSEGAGVMLPLRV